MVCGGWMSSTQSFYNYVELIDNYGLVESSSMVKYHFTDFYCFLKSFSQTQM